MKITLIYLLIIPNFLFAQSTLITPDAGIQTNLSQLNVKTNTGVVGLQHTDGLVNLGSFISLSGAVLSTYSNHPLYFTSNNQPFQMGISAGQLVSIGAGVVSQKLNVNGNLKAESLQPTFNSNIPVYTDNLGTLFVYKTQNLSIPRSAFKPSTVATGSASTQCSFSQEGGIFFPTSAVGLERFRAAVNLPVGAIITGYEFYYVDNSTTRNLNFKFSATEYGSNTSIDNIFFSTVGATAGVNTVSDYGINQIPIGSNYTYMINISCVGGTPVSSWEGVNTQVIGVKLIYKY